jgi:hypothetical protein
VLDRRLCDPAFRAGVLKIIISLKQFPAFLQ